MLDVIGLVGGQHLGEVAVHPELLGELAGRRLVVARDDRDVLDAALAQALDDAADLGPYRRAQLERAAELVVDGDHHHRVAFAMHLVEGVFHLSRQRDTLQLHEAPAADAHSMPVDADRDAIADLVLGRIGQRQAQALLLRLLQDGERDRVMKPPLGRRSEAKDLESARKPLAAITRPTSGRSRVNVPVLSKSTVSTSHRGRARARL